MAGFIEVFGSFKVYIKINPKRNAIIIKINNWVRNQKEFYWKHGTMDELLQLWIRDDPHHDVELMVSCLRDFYSMCTSLNQNIEISSGAAGYHVVCGGYAEFGAIHVEASTKLSE